MNRDFKNRIELLSYTERRVVIDIDRYARDLMRIGDIFPPDPYGVYDAVTGACIVDFGNGGYWVDRNTTDRRHPTRREIRDFHDFEQAKGAIYNNNGDVTVTAVNVRRIQVTDDRPAIHKARGAAAALFGETLFDSEDHVSVSPGINTFRECVYLDELEDSARMTSQLARLRHDMQFFISDVFQNDRFKELVFHCKASTYIVDVTADVRIKKYYLQKFEEEDLAVEESRISSEGYRSY